MHIGFRYLVGVVLLAGVLVLLHAWLSPPADTATHVSVPTVAASAGNHSPSISSDAAAYARAGEPYQFQPQAVDPDGDPLTFTAENLPPWAHIDPASGAVTGTPADSDVGEYESITVTVADGSQRASTAPFSITVVPRVTVATLEWEPPMAKGDGSPLDDLAGYRIVYGRSADDLDHSVYIGDPAQTSFEFTGLAPGTWYFAVIAVNASGLEGPPTPPAMKFI